MNEIEIKFIVEKKLTPFQESSILKLQKECFSDVDRQSIEEDFISQEFGRLFAYQGRKIVGMLGLFKRKIKFGEKEIVFGGTGGVCVAKSMRRKGIATKMLKEGLKLLKKEKCDIACFNVDLKKEAYLLYEKVGFKTMMRKISFENVKGEIKYDAGTMFTPLCSQAVYDYVMQSKNTFHYGKGYW